MNANNPHPEQLQIGEDQIQLLERLSNASAVSGDEGEVRRIVLEQVRPVVEGTSGEVKVDAMGNVLVTRPGKEPGGLRVMMAAHMDEVGFMITGDDDKGFFRFENVGTIDARQMPGKPVLVGSDHIPGVIGAKPIHLVQRDEVKRIIAADSLRIDAGTANGKIKVGDRATFATRFARLGPSVRGKALDNRLGVAILIELVKNSPPNIDLLAAFTVQEEVGLRGGRVAGYSFNPDLAIVLDSTPAYDMPAYPDHEGERVENMVYNTRLGEGPAIYIVDSGTLSDPRLVRFLAETAEKHGLPYQYRQPGGGSTDAGAIHRVRGGIPAVSLSVPSRYQHSAVSIAWLSDWQNTLSLAYLALKDITRTVLAAER